MTKGDNNVATSLTNEAGLVVGGGALSNALSQNALASDTDMGGAQPDKDGGLPSLLLCADQQVPNCKKLYVETLL